MSAAIADIASLSRLAQGGLSTTDPNRKRKLRPFNRQASIAGIVTPIKEEGGYPSRPLHNSLRSLNSVHLVFLSFILTVAGDFHRAGLFLLTLAFFVAKDSHYAQQAAFKTAFLRIF